MKILVVLPVKEHHKELFLKSAPKAEFIYEDASKVTKDMLKDVDATIGNISPALLAGCENIKWVQLNSAGTDGYTADGVLSKDAVLTNATGAYGLAISEHMVAAVLCMMKKLDLYSSNMRTHEWKDMGPVSSVWGSKTLVVGLGDIGGEFAKRMHALGSSVTAIRRNKAESPDYVDALYQMDMLDECLKEADIVASCLPGTKETYKLYDADKFSKMKEGAFFLNIGRGTAVDSDALLNALDTGQLAGASIDVTDPEPLPKDHPLWNAKNLLITPHVSGGYHLNETFERIVAISADNLARFVSGKPLKNVVDLDTGYRKFIKSGE